MAAVNDKARCVSCGRSGWSRKKTGAFIFCDSCPCGFHLFCAGEKVEPPKSASWHCPLCTSAPRPAPAAPAATAETFVASKRAKVDKHPRRLAAGLEEPGIPVGPALDAALARLLEHSEAPSTRKKKVSTRALYDKFVTGAQLEAERDSARAIAGFVLWRMKGEVSADTIRADVGVLRENYRDACDSVLVRRALRAADRILVAPDGSKLPLTLAQLKQLGETIDDWSTKLTAEESKHLLLRDKTFFFLGFVGLFRSAELVALQWDHLTAVWLLGKQERLVPWGEQVAGGVLKYLIVRVVESKVDWKGKGEEVRICAVAGAACPLRMLEELFELRRKGQKTVFAEVRLKEDPKPLQTDTLRSRMKTYLRAFLSEGEVTDLSLHSLRKGGATALAARQIEPRLIKHQGRWKSDAVFLYTLTSDQERLAVSETVVAALNLLYA